MPCALFRLVFALAVMCAPAARLLAATSDAPNSAWRAANPRWLSGGVYAALAAEGTWGGIAPSRAQAGGVADLSKGKPPAVLDARVGANVRLGDDPAALPAGQRSQAEPHLTRSAATPDLLLATFQEGRFAAGGGSIDCGYAVSRDGGLSWTRALIPQLTTASGGAYRRATDPVAAIGPQGDLYLATLAAIDDAFGSADLVVSRSTDGGATWLAPSIAFHQTTSLAAPDKDWLAVNDFPGTPNSGQLTVTWTNFTANASGAATGNNLLASVSDDRGATWSAPAAITSTGSLNQGTQPLFLPDGSLVVVYITFANASTGTNFGIQCKRSMDGGRTYPAAATTVVAFVNGFDDPDLRSGVFLPSAAVARTSGEIFVTYVSLVLGTPRVMVTKSSDQGATWSPPVVASDNPAGVAVDNPAIAVTPDGSTAAVVFVDKRNSPVTSSGHAYLIDHYAAQSFDGGATWQPNLRLSELSSDVRNAPLTSEGYMLGDYLAMAPPAAATSLHGQVFVPIWCDPRTGDVDPFIARLAPSATGDYAAWCAARGLIQTAAVEDADGDGVKNFLEYIDGTDPRAANSGAALVVKRSGDDTVDIAWTQRSGAASPFGLPVLYVLPDSNNTDIPLQGTATGVPLAVADLPKISVRDGLGWTGVRANVPAGSARALGRGFRVTLGQVRPTTAEPVTVTDTNARLINLSTRGIVGTGSGQLAVGFVIDGPKSILVRAAGPALGAFGVNGVLADPFFQIGSTDPAGFDVRTNDNWQQGNATPALFTRLGAFPFANGSLDAAFLVSLGFRSYTAVVSGVNNTSGIALAEIYDADPVPGAPGNPRLLNVSTRARTGSGADALTAGFVLGGTQPRRVLVRAIGPSLANFGVTDPLADPVLTLYDGGGQVVAVNDDWEISRSSAAVAATAQNVGAFALNAASLDAALLLTLAPGAYTAVVTSANGATGTALVEIYDAN